MQNSQSVFVMSLLNYWIIFESSYSIIHTHICQCVTRHHIHVISSSYIILISIYQIKYQYLIKCLLIKLLFTITDSWLSHSYRHSYTYRHVTHNKVHIIFIAYALWGSIHPEDTILNHLVTCLKGNYNYQYGRFSDLISTYSFRLGFRI